MFEENEKKQQEFTKQEYLYPYGSEIPLNVFWVDIEFNNQIVESAKFVVYQCPGKIIGQV